MEYIYMVREYLKAIYAKFDIYIISVAKFLLTFFTLSNINTEIGFLDKIDDTAIVLLTSLLCALLPWGVSAIAMAVFVLGHFYALSLELAGIMLIIFIIMFCMYLRFGTGDSVFMVITLLLFFVNMPYIVPVFTGLTAGVATAAIPVAFGIIIYYMINFAAGNADVLSAGGSSPEEMLERFKLIVDNAFQDRLMILMIVAFAVTIILVYMIRKLAIDYAWLIAVIFGVIVNIIIMLIGKAMMDVTISTASLILGSMLSIVLMVILQVFIFAVDYRKKLNVQFEDEDYVYYVKAVPKVKYNPGQKPKSAPNKKPVKKLVPKAEVKRPAEAKQQPQQQWQPQQQQQPRMQAKPKPVMTDSNLHDEKK